MWLPSLSQNGPTRLIPTFIPPSAQCDRCRAARRPLRIPANTTETRDLSETGSCVTSSCASVLHLRSKLPERNPVHKLSRATTREIESKTQVGTSVQIAGTESRPRHPFPPAIPCLPKPASRSRPARALTRTHARHWVRCRSLRPPGSPTVPPRPPSRHDLLRPHDQPGAVVFQLKRRPLFQ